MFVPVGVILRKFKKQSRNGNYRKTITAFLELVQRNEDIISQSRAKIRDKGLKDPANLHKQFSEIVSHEATPLSKEAAKIAKRRTEDIRRKLDKFNADSK